MIDTGGYDTGEEPPFAGHIREQVELAVGAADVVLFVVDGRAGPLVDDHEIADGAAPLARARASSSRTSSTTRRRSSRRRRSTSWGSASPSSSPRCTA